MPVLASLAVLVSPSAAQNKIVNVSSVVILSLIKKAQTCKAVNVRTLSSRIPLQDSAVRVRHADVWSGIRGVGRRRPFPVGDF